MGELLPLDPDELLTTTRAVRRGALAQAGVHRNSRARRAGRPPGLQADRTTW